MIGGALAERLLRLGHDVVLATRDGRDGGLAIDMAGPPPDAVLQRQFAGTDVVVNTVGIFVPGPAQQGFDAVHVNGPRQVFEAARRAGVRRVVQVSALGADAASPLPYFRSKGRMDAWLLRDPGLDATIVRPSLVFSPAGASTRLFATLAGLPATPLPGGGRQPVQPVHLDDLVDALARLVASARPRPAVVEAVGPRALPLRDYLQVFRRAPDGRVRVFGVPGALARTAAALAPRLGLPFDRDALAMLEAGSTADPAPFARILGRAPRDPRDFLAGDGRCGLADAARLAWLLPTMRAALAAMWVGTAIVSLWVYPREASLALLSALGLEGAAATAALWAGAGADLVLGLAILLPRTRTPAYAAQLLLVLAYTLLISIWLPAQWAHPFGPVLKNVPLLAMILFLFAMDRRHGPAVR